MVWVDRYQLALELWKQRFPGEDRGRDCRKGRVLSSFSLWLGTTILSWNIYYWIFSIFSYIFCQRMCCPFLFSNQFLQSARNHHNFTVSRALSILLNIGSFATTKWLNGKCQTPGVVELWERTRLREGFWWNTEPWEPNKNIKRAGAWSYHQIPCQIPSRAAGCVKLFKKLQSGC